MRNRNRAARIGDFTATPYRHIRIVAHTQKRRKSKQHIIAVKAITFAAALMMLYGMLLFEFHPIAGFITFVMSFGYLLLFA